MHGYDPRVAVVGTDSADVRKRLQRPAKALDPNAWLRYEKTIGLPSVDCRSLFPDFLVVSSARTGTTWMSANLGRDPRFLISPEKEVRYFDVLWRRYPIEWYCRRFAREPGRLAGDVSPTYALLPTFAIKHIHSLKPELKIVFLLRHMPRRAWSHLRHTLKYGEANFVGREDDSQRISHDDQVRNVVHDFLLSSGDYEGIIRRWATSFPREQIHIAFFEDAIAAPEKYFARLLTFLGVRSSLLAEPIRCAVNQGDNSRPTKKLTRFISEIYAKRQQSLERYLQEEFGLSPWWPAVPLKTGTRSAIPLPDSFYGNNIELHDGMFRAARKRKWWDQPSGQFEEGPSAYFISDLHRMLNPESFGDETELCRGGLSLEDRRLVHAIDRLAESARFDHLEDQDLRL